MKKTELKQAVDVRITETRTALQTVYDALNKGQKQKLVKNEAIKALFDMYGVEYSE